MVCKRTSIFLGITFIILLFLFLIIFTYKDVLHRVDTDEKVLYLTFDDGPGQYTEEVLDILKNNNVSATFFLLGMRAEKNPEIVLQIVEEGYSIGVHSYSHPFLFRNISGELIAGKSVLESITNQQVNLFRSPYGFTLPRTLRVAKGLGLDVISWSCFPRDYSATTEQIISRVSKCFKPGEIIVLHPWNNPQTVKALPEIISAAKESGYIFEVLK